MMTEHNILTGSQLHEPKGIAAATAGQVYIADGAASGTMTTPTSVTFPTPANTVTQGFWLYEDLTTASTPIPLTTPGTEYTLTNDGAGAGTLLTYGLDSMTNIWDVATDRFIFDSGSVLALGDTVEIRVDLDIVTTNVNTAVDVTLELDPAGTPYEVHLLPETNYKATGTYNVDVWMGIPIDTVTALTTGARIKASADTAGATVKTNNWYVRALHTNV